MATTMQFSLLSTFILTILHLASAQQESEQPPSNYDHIVITHATLMSLAFVLLLPLGVFLLRLSRSPHTVLYHATTQLLALSLALAGFGLGAWMATTSGAWNASNGHPILGTVIVSLLLLQPALGYVHHRIYVSRKKGKEGGTVWGVTHMWYGRVLILLAVINGGLGLQLSENTVKGEIAYGVIAGVMFLLYLAVLGWFYMRKGRSSSREGGEKSRGSDKEVVVDGFGGGAADGAGSRPLGRERRMRTEFEPEPKGDGAERARLSVRNE